MSIKNNGPAGSGRCTPEQFFARSSWSRYEDLRVPAGDGSAGFPPHCFNDIVREEARDYPRDGGSPGKVFSGTPSNSGSNLQDAFAVFPCQEKISPKSSCRPLKLLARASWHVKAQS